MLGYMTGLKQRLHDEHGVEIKSVKAVELREDRSKWRFRVVGDAHELMVAEFWFRRKGFDVRRVHCSKNYVEITQYH